MFLSKFYLIIIFVVQLSFQCSPTIINTHLQFWVVWFVVFLPYINPSKLTKLFSFLGRDSFYDEV